jgi:aminoglycoside phosphotransferase (APT) family kinase protein
LQARLTPEQRHLALRTLGAFLARLHTIPVEGFGTLHPASDGLAGCFHTQWEDIAALLEGAWWREPLLASGLATEAELSRLRSLLEANRGLFARERACLVWQDGGLKNLVVADGTVTGMVDLENVAAGAPLNDFVLLHYESEAELAAVKEGYGAPAMFDAAFDRAFLLLRLLYAYPTLTHHLRRANARRVADLQARIRHLLAALGS